MQTHTRNLLGLIALTGILFLTKFQLQTTEFSMIGVSLSHLAHQADLALYANDSDTVLNESDTVFNESDFNTSTN